MDATDDFFDGDEEDEEDGAEEDDGAKGKEEKSTDPQNRALPDILKICPCFFPRSGRTADCWPRTYPTD